MDSLLSMDLTKQLENFTQAEEVSMPKMMGEDSVVFIEYRKNDKGTCDKIEHHALPVVYKDLKKLQELQDKLDELKRKSINDVLGKNEELQKLLPHSEEERIEFAKNPENLAKATALGDELKTISRKYNDEMNEIRLDMAVLVFSRTGDYTREQVSNFLDIQQLQAFEYIAFGLSVPPKQLPGGSQKKQKKK